MSEPQPAFDTGNNRILTFHYRSETEHETKTDVNSFIKDSNNIVKIFKTVKDKEFPDKEIKGIKVNGITASTKNRKKILKEFRIFKNTHKDIFKKSRELRTKKWRSYFNLLKIKKSIMLIPIQPINKRR